MSAQKLGSRVSAASFRFDAYSSRQKRRLLPMNWAYPELTASVIRETDA
jgi:hypothetical protein